MFIRFCLIALLTYLLCRLGHIRPEQSMTYYAAALVIAGPIIEIIVHVRRNV